MAKKREVKSDLSPDPVGDALADVYLFLLRKAAVRERAMVAKDSEAQDVTAPAQGADVKIFEQKARNVQTLVCIRNEG